jgi:5-methylcytosine-specific restriction enzyme A
MISHPYLIGEEYDRAALSDFVGSRQTQTGILWGEKEPGVVICTSGGRHGAKAGYFNRKNADGSWTYFGQGEIGDQDPNKYSNRQLVEAIKSILLFRTQEPRAAKIKQTGSWKKSYTFEGEFVSGGWDWFIPSEGLRKGNKLIRFTFFPVRGACALYRARPQVNDGEMQLSTVQIRDRIREQKSDCTKVQSVRECFLRSDLLRLYARKRAMGACELCGEKAPFSTPAGEPFLEVHHILRLADDGPDDPENVAALCPNCHRNAHYGKDSDEIRRKLVGLITTIESRY